MVTVKELLDKFNLDIDLSNKVLNLSFDEDYESFEEKTEDGVDYFEFYSKNSLLVIIPSETDCVLSYSHFAFEGAPATGGFFNDEGIQVTDF